MHHIAILSKKPDYIKMILEGKKTIESRWYVNKIAPYNKISAGDVLYLKRSGGMVEGKALVSKVIQFDNLDTKTVKEIYKKYGKEIFPDLNEDNIDKYVEGKAKKNYCILIFLKNPKKLKHFQIDKTGFGNACAWMCVGDIKKVIG